MEIRYFQIIIPILASCFIYAQYREYAKNKASMTESILITIFWVGVIVLAMFPDFFSDTIASIFGIKDNINALIFFALGLLFYFQLKLYKTLKKQDEVITKLARKITLDQHPPQ